MLVHHCSLIIHLLLLPASSPFPQSHTYVVIFGCHERHPFGINTLLGVYKSANWTFKQVHASLKMSYICKERGKSSRGAASADIRAGREGLAASYCGPVYTNALKSCVVKQWLSLSLSCLSTLTIALHAYHCYSTAEDQEKGQKWTTLIYSACSSFSFCAKQIKSLSSECFTTS